MFEKYEGEKVFEPVSQLEQNRPFGLKFSSLMSSCTPSESEEDELEKEDMSTLSASRCLTVCLRCTFTKLFYLHVQIGVSHVAGKVSASSVSLGFMVNAQTPKLTACNRRKSTPMDTLRGISNYKRFSTMVVISDPRCRSAD